MRSRYRVLCDLWFGLTQCAGALNPGSFGGAVDDSEPIRNGWRDEIVVPGDAVMQRISHGWGKDRQGNLRKESSELFLRHKWQTPSLVPKRS